MKRTTVIVTIVAVLALPLAGCALLANPTVDAVIQAVIDVVIGQLLDKNPTAASQVATDATALQQLASGNTATLSTFITQADTVINASTLNSDDKLAFASVITVAAGLLGQGASALSPSASVNLAMVFGDIANAAQVYGAATGLKGRLAIPK